MRNRMLNRCVTDPAAAMRINLRARILRGPLSRRDSVKVEDMSRQLTAPAAKLSAL